MTKFSDIPPLLIDNKPTALNGIVKIRTEL